MRDLTITAVPILVSRAVAAELLDTHERRIQALDREGYLTARYADTKPRYLVSELVEYAESLPTEPPR